MTKPISNKELLWYNRWDKSAPELGLWLRICDNRPKPSPDSYFKTLVVYHARKEKMNTTKSCPTCHKTKPLTAFSPDKGKKDGLSSQCKECRNATSRRWHKEHPVTNHKNRRTKAMLVSGITIEEYFDASERQNKKCAICGNEETYKNQWGVKKLAVDHDHMTGEFRGLLCQSCNTKLAVVEDKDFMEKAMDYLVRSRDKKS